MPKSEALETPAGAVMRIEASARVRAEPAEVYRHIAHHRAARPHVVRAEPEPGRLLVETDQESGAVTTFLVEPAGQGATRVRISTELQTRPGVLGWIQRRVTGSFLRKAYDEELGRIEEHVSAGASAG